MKNNKVTFWDFLKNHKIEIPTIQRDYAQGRKDKTALRKKFLCSIQTSLSDNKELLLDFIYGVQKSEAIYPIDGQQRLTTLWLLHWYAAFKSKNRRYYVDILKRFSYKTRSSSADFICALCEALKQEKFTLNENQNQTISNLIQSQTWFYAGWHQDPTVRAMLRMLSGTGKDRDDGIQMKFQNDNNLNKLFSTTECPIHFYYLDLDGIKQADRLYVKMNARGEQLTDFENFKADLMTYLEDRNEQLEKSFLDDFFQKWDVEWTNLFWCNCRTLSNEKKIEEKRIDKIDDVFFLWIKRYLLTQYICESNNAEDDIIEYLYDGEWMKYDSFENFEKIFGSVQMNFWQNLKKTLDTICCKYDAIASNIKLQSLLKTREYSLVGDLLPQMEIVDKPASTSFQHRIVSYGIYSFLSSQIMDSLKDDDSFTSYFEQWLRLVANITYGDEVSNKVAFVARLKLIQNIWNKIVDRKEKDIYERFSSFCNES